MKYFFTMLLLFFIIACGQKDKNFQELTEMMTGSFSSENQSIADSSFYHITLEMVRIWPDLKDGVWLYVEQAVAEYRDKPYRQRIYHLQQIDATNFTSDIYTFPDPLNMAGAYQTPEKFDAFTSASLIERDGCTVYIEKQADGSYTGSTKDQECTSSLRGAFFATTEVTITDTQLISWDRGFDAEGNQVWGAEKSGYIFDKIKD